MYPLCARLDITLKAHTHFTKIESEFLLSIAKHLHHMAGYEEPALYATSAPPLLVFWLSSNASLNVFWYVMHVWYVIELMKIHQNQRSKTLIKKKVHLERLLRYNICGHMTNTDEHGKWGRFLHNSLLFYVWKLSHSSWNGCQLFPSLLDKRW